MNKIFGHIAILLVFSWVTTANAGSVVASIDNLSGDVVIDGFRSGFPTADGDNDPSTINFLFDYYSGGTVSIFQPIVKGNFYNVSLDGISNLGAFSANFKIVSPIDFNHTGSLSIDAILAGLFPSTVSVSGSPLGALTVQGNTLNLLSVTAGPIIGGYALKLATQVTNGRAINTLLNSLDRNDDGSLTGTFSNSDLRVVPEPTILLLLGSGLLGMFGLSKKRA